MRCTSIGLGRLCSLHTSRLCLASAVLCTGSVGLTAAGSGKVGRCAIVVTNFVQTVVGMLITINVVRSVCGVRISGCIARHPRI